MERRWIIAIGSIAVIAAVVIGAFYYQTVIMRRSPVVRIGYHPALCLIQIYTAIDRGVMEEYGIEYEFIEFATGGGVVEAFAAGDIDVGYLGGPPAMLGILQDIPIKIVAAAHTEGSAIIVKKGAGINTIADLNGKKIGEPGLPSIQSVIIRGTLMDNEIDADLIEMKPALMPESLRAGAIDAYIAWPPFNTQSILGGWGEALVTPENLWPGNPCCIIAAREEFMENHPDTLKNLLYISQLMSIWSMAHPYEAAVSANNLLGFNITVSEASLRFAPNYDLVPPDPEKWNASLVRFVDTLYDLEYIDTKPSTDIFLDFTLLEEVKAEHPEIFV